MFLKFAHILPIIFYTFAQFSQKFLEYLIKIFKDPIYFYFNKNLRVSNLFFFQFFLSFVQNFFKFPTYFPRLFSKILKFS